MILLLLACNAPNDTDGDCVSDAQFFQDRAALVLADCQACHIAGGLAGDTRVILDDPSMDLFQGWVQDPELAALLLDKPTAQVSHTGGQRVDLYSDGHRVLDELVARAQEPGQCEHPGAPLPTCDQVVGAPLSPRRLTDDQIANAMADLLGVQVASGLLPETTRAKDFRTFAVNNTVTAANAEALLLAVERVVQSVDVGALTGCEGDVDCARAWLLDWGARAYRRPLTEREGEILTAYLDAGLSADAGVAMGLQVALLSPQFLYLDLVPAESGVLDDHAIAARLSFFLLNTTPDDTLLAAAAAGELHTRDQVAEHAARMLQDPAVLRSITAFHHDWLDTYRLDGAERDPDAYPWVSDATWESARTELDLVITEVVWAGDASFDALMFSDVSWIDSELAALYGLPDPGPGWHRVSLAPDRVGVLTRPAFLAGHAHATSSSPVQRGAFVLEQLLCEDLSPPQDVDMDLIEDAGGEAQTVREQLEQHWTDPNCQACHLRIDPLGFAFENYGAMGEWRDTWSSGIAVDATGSLDDPPGDFDGASEMVALIASQERARACYAQRWYEYALGRPATVADTCGLGRVQQRFHTTDGDLRQLLIDVAVADAFRVQEAP